MLSCSAVHLDQCPSVGFCTQREVWQQCLLKLDLQGMYTTTPEPPLVYQAVSLVLRRFKPP